MDRGDAQEEIAVAKKHFWTILIRCPEFSIQLFGFIRVQIGGNR
jgi:hypothetical protein